jgi:hypothetical protein
MTKRRCRAMDAPLSAHEQTRSKRLGASANRRCDHAATVLMMSVPATAEANEPTHVLGFPIAIGRRKPDRQDKRRSRRVARRRWSRPVEAANAGEGGVPWGAPSFNAARRIGCKDGASTAKARQTLTARTAPLGWLRYKFQPPKLHRRCFAIV